MPEAILSIIVVALVWALLSERKRSEQRETELLSRCLEASGLSRISLDTAVDEPPPVTTSVPKGRPVRFTFPEHLKPVAPLGTRTASASKE